MMKKFYAMAIALLALASCSNEDLLNEGIVEEGAIRATIEQGAPTSRLAIDANNALTWQTGDAFALFGEGSTNKFTLKSGNSENTATFTGAVPASIQGAAFPYTETTTPALSNGTLTMTLPATLDQTTSGVCNLPMWASQVTSNSVSFKHLAGLLKAVLTGIPSDYTQLVVKASNPISGEFTATTSEQEPVLATDANVSDENNTVTVSFSAMTSGQDRSLYIPLPVGTYASIAVSVESTDNNHAPIALATYTNKTVARANVYTAALNYQSINATTPAEVNNALSTTGSSAQLELTGTIDATAQDASAIIIPTEKTSVSLDFTQAPTTSDTAPLKIESNTSAQSGASTQVFNIDMADATSGSETYLDINTPTATVHLNSGTFAKVTAKTATNTLIIGEGVKIGELVLNGGNVKLEGDLELSTPLVIGIETTIDLNGHTIKPAGTSMTKILNTKDALILVRKGGNLTITDSSTECTGSIDTGNNSSIYGAIKMTDSTDEATGDATLTIQGGSIKGYYYGIMGNGNGGNRNGTVITMTGGTIEEGYCSDDNTGIFHPQVGTLTISGGEVTAYKSAVEMRSGKLVISDGTFTSTGSPAAAEANGNGNTITGAAIAISQHTSNQDLEAEISGGTFEGVYALYEEDKQDENVSNISMSVTGGTFNGSIFTENCTTAITGGTFSEPSACYYLGTNANVTVNMEEDYEGAGFKTTSGQTVEMTIAEDKTYTVTAPLVGSTGTQNLGFQFLQGSTVTISGGKITSSDAKMLINNYSDLTLKGVTLAPTIPDTMNGQTYYVLSNNCGTVNIEDGTTITAPTSSDTSNCPTVYAFDVCKYSSYPSVTVNVKGGTITGNVEYTGTENDKQKLVISGGTITGNLVVGESYKQAASNGGITITGGMQEGTGWSEYQPSTEEN